MRRFAKRSICLLLTIVMLLGMLPTVALAAHDGSGRPLDLTGKVVLSLYTGNDFPGEPNTHTNTSGYVSFTSSFNKAGSYNNSYASSASTVLKSSILDNLIQGTNLVYWGRTYYVWGAYDTDGLTGYFADNNSIFEDANVNKMIKAVKGSSASTDTHEIVWYVIKYQTSDSAWHIDGIVREKAKYSVNYYGNGNTGGGAPLGGSTYAAGTTYTILGNTGSGNDGDLVRTVGGVEYEFIGWNTKDDGTGTSYKPGDTVTLNETNFPKHTLSLYAQWQAKNAGYTATVKTYLDSSLRDVSDIYGANDLTLHLSKDGGTTLIPLTHQGIDGTYTATGVANGTYTLYRKGSGSEVHRVGDYTLSISNSAGSLDVLHYSVAYDLNGGTGSAPAAANYISGTKVTVASGTPTRSGYYFLGWKDEEGTVYQPDETLTISKQHRLTAQWEKTVSVTVNVTINHAGGNGYDQMETKDDVQLALVRRANSSSAYLETGNTLKLNKTSHMGFTYAENTNITTYTANGATFTDMPGGTAEYTVVTSKSGYDTTITPTKDANGNWIINVEMTYNPTNFDLNFTVNVDESVPERYIPDAVIAKVTFWSSDRNRWEIITQHEGGNPGVRVDIDQGTRSGAGSYPVWKYESNGTNPYGYRIQVTAFVYPDGTIIPASQVLQQDVKWSDNVYIATLGDVSSSRTYGTLSGAYFDDGSSAQKGTLKATVEMPLYNVSFKANGGKIEAQDSLTLVEQYRVPNLNSYVPVREGGYVFEGWYLDANGNGTLDAEETATVNSGDDLTTNITLIAKWKEPLTIQGTVTVDGSYMQGSDYVDIKDADRPKDVQVRLWEVGHDGAIAVWEGNFGAYSVTNEIDTASVNYSFTGIPNDGTQYRIMVTITNYKTTYDHEPTDGTFSATEYTAILNGDNTAVVNAHLSFEPESYVQTVEVDATAIAEGFRPTSVLAEILYRNSGSTGVFARISQHEVAPNGIEIALTSGVGNGQDEVWKTLYNAMAYEYAVNISEVDGAAYSAADARYQILYSGTTVWDNAHDELTGGEIDANGIYTGILKATLVPREYKVNFDFNAGTAPIGGMGDYLHLDGNYYTTHKWSFDTHINAEPTRSGYVFAGWSCSTSGAYDGEKVAATTAQDITLTAQWKADSNGDDVADENQVVVTFKVVNGSWNDGTSADKKVWVTLSGGSGTLNSGDVPAVGTKPAPGYTIGAWDSEPNTADGGITEAVTYTYTYVLRSDLSYTVRHVVKGSGKILSESTTDNQVYNTSVTAGAATFEGYTLEGANEQTVTLTQDGTVITFYYTPNNNITVTFKHQKSDGSKLHDDTTLSATMDSVLTLANYQAAITGYDYANTNPLTYTVKEKDNVVTLVYAPKTYSYTVEYYFDDVLDASRTESAVYSSVINASTCVLGSVPTDYVLDTIVGAPLTVGADESKNVIRFYYAKDTNSNGIPDKYEVTVTYKIFNGTWSDSTTEPKTATVVLATASSVDGVSVWTPAAKTLADTVPAGIPTGMTPTGSYDASSGRWDEPISDTTAVTADVTYNYRYHYLNQYDLVIRTINGTVTKVNEATVNTAEYNVYDITHDTVLVSTFEVSANSGYALESVTVDGVERTLGTVDGKPAMPVSEVDRTKDHAIVVTYGKDTNGDGIADCFQKPVTFKVVNGKWDDGSTTDITEWVSLKDDGAWSKNGSGDLSAPAAGSKPAEHYKTGSWNTALPATVSGTDPVTYTYTYTPEVKDVTVTFVVVNGTWDGTNSSDKTVSVTLTAGKGTLAEANIPIVGSMPDAGYEAGSWDPTPVTAANGITGDVTYTYIYAPIISTATVTFKVVGGTWDGSDSSDKTVSVTLTAGKGTLANSQVPNGMQANAGYQTSGSWNTIPTTTDPITGDVTYIYSFAPSVVENKSVAYRVEHYLEDAFGAYHLDDTATETKVLHYTVIDGVVDVNSYTVDGAPVSDTVSASAKSFAHHNYASSDLRNVVALAITSDSGTVSFNHDSTMKLYYTAKEYDVTYDFNGGSGANGVNYSDQTNLRYGTQLYIKAAPLNSGYHFMGWALDLNGNNVLDEAEKVSSNLHPAGASRTLTGNQYMIAYWQPRTDLSYTVRYLENGPNTQLAPNETVIGQTFGTTVQRNALTSNLLKSFEHFTLDSASSTNSVTIGMGDNIFYLYYTRNSYNYTVEYYYSNVKDDAATESGSAPYGSAVSAYAPKLKPGYELERVEPINAITNDTAANVIKVYYKPTHTATVTFKVVNGTWGDGTVADKTVAIVLVDGKGTLDSALVPLGMQANSGFGDGEWDHHLNLNDKGITGDVTYTFRYKPISGLSYTVNYLEKDSNRVLATAKTQGGMTYGDTVTAESEKIAITGYRYDSASVSTLTIGTGENTLNLYYTRESAPPVPPVVPVVPTTGSVTLTKVDSADRNTTLANVVFDLYKADGTFEGTYTTGSDGTVTVNDLPAGEHYWIEIRPAEGYMLDTSKHEFTVSGGKNSEISISNTRTPVPGVFSGDHYAYVIGYSDGLVHPEANITRAEVATIFFRLLDDATREQYMTKENSFADVEKGMWFNTAVSTMAAMGIVNGYPDGNFHPNANITRAEFAAIAARFDSSGNTTGVSFSDIYGHWAQKEINLAYNNGWILGYEDGTFKPNQNIIRAEAMTLINRVLQRVPEHEDDLLDNMTTWPDNMDTNKWYYLAVQEATNSHDYGRKENGYEYWTVLKEVRDWSELER